MRYECIFAEHKNIGTVLLPTVSLYARASALCVRIVIVQVYVFWPCSPGTNMITASAPSLSCERK
jgi:hypothetical protein